MLEFDVFISHASEDKDDFVRPLVDALKALGLSVWYDEDQILLGDDFRAKMDQGLALARFGVVVLSPSFKKYWPESELSALFNQERVFGKLKILPVLHHLSHADVTNIWPLAAAKASISSIEGEDHVAEEIAKVIRARSVEPSRQGGPDSQSRSPFYGLPALPSTHFVGREADLGRLADLLGPSSVALAASVEGLAGIGKTELALKLAQRLEQTDSFPGGIFWLSAEDPDLTTIWGSTIANSLGIDSGPTNERASLAIRRVQRQTGRVLLVLDNVEKWNAESKPHPLPEGSHV
ncbi:MAG: TIR domain-containing protein, partial [Acidobacteriota bacterium]